MSSDSLDEIGRELRRLRTATGLSGVRLALLAGVPQATVSRVETGVRVADPAVVVALFAALGLDPADLGRLADQVRAVYQAATPSRVDAGVSFRAGSRAGWEREARVIRSFESVAMPTLLRTAEYSAAADAAETDAGRAADVLEDTERTFTFLLAEPALRTWPGTGDCMPAQLARLLAVAERPNVRLGVVPAAFSPEPTRPALPIHGFTVYDESAVSVETFSRDLTLTAEHDVRTYLQVFDGFQGAAVFGEEARELIARARDDFQTVLSSIHRTH